MLSPRIRHQNGYLPAIGRSALRAHAALGAHYYYSPDLASNVQEETGAPMQAVGRVQRVMRAGRWPV